MIRENGTQEARGRRTPLALLLGAVVLVTAVLATGCGREVAGTASAAVDLTDPASTAEAAVDAFNRRDLEQFVGELVCEDGRTLGEDGETTLAEETLYRDIAPFDPDSEPAVATATPVFAIEEVRGIRPSDAGYSEEMTNAQVAIVTVGYPDAPPDVRAQLPDLKGVLTMVEEAGAWVVCEMGFVPVGSVSGEVAPDPDPTSPTGRAQAFVAAVNAGDIAGARVFMCARASAVNRFAEEAIADGAQLRLNARVETFGDGEANGALQIWYTVAGQERRARGFMQQESDGWCVMALDLLA